MGVDFNGDTTNIGARLTIMVKIINISQYDGELPEQEGDRKISNGPLYEKNHVLNILGQKGSASQAIVPWTRKCVADLQRYELDDTDLIELLSLALEQNNYKGSEWCESKPGGVWAACDAYRVLRSEYVANQDRSYQMDYYIKFAVSRQGKVLLLVSCHY